MLPALGRCISQLSLTGVRGQFVRTSHSLTVINNDKRLAAWNRAISNAEKIVGLPNSNFTMKLLMSDSGVGAGSHIRKLLNTTHPVIKTIKKLIYCGKNNLQTRGLVILLLSRCAGHIEGSPQMLLGEWEEATVDGITERQRNLSEIVEMVYTSHLIHRDVLNVSRELITDESLLNDLQYGNKIAILVGDILIANASKKTSELNNCKVLELIANAIGNFMKSEFVIRHDSFGKPFPAVSMTSANWEDRIILNSGALLSSACQSTVLMAGHGDSAQQKANEFGKCLGLIWQLHEELQPFSNLIYQAPGAPFDLTSLPCVLFLERNPHLVQSLESSLENINHIDYADLYTQILASGCVEEANLRLNRYVHGCLANLDTFDSCYKAKQALIDIIEAMKHV